LMKEIEQKIWDKIRSKNSKKKKNKNENWRL
jgi:hypothetical protein